MLIGKIKRDFGKNNTNSGKKWTSVNKIDIFLPGGGVFFLPHIVYHDAWRPQLEGTIQKPN
jgi:hypothetical protein